MKTDLWFEILKNLASFLVFLMLISGLTYFIMRALAKKAKSNILLSCIFSNVLLKGCK
jgi:hypothetical protein